MIKDSRVGDTICFSQSDSPKDIAEAILKIDLNKEHNSREVLNELNNELVEQLKLLLS